MFVANPRLTTPLAPRALSMPWRLGRPLNFLKAREFAISRFKRGSAHRPLAVLQVREDGEYYIPDRLTDEDGEADRALVEAALAYTRKVRDAQGLLDDAINSVGVLLDALEQDADTRAAQARTALEMAVECIHNAHARIDEQESQDQNLFLAHFEGNGEEEEKEEAGPRMDG